MQPLYKYLPSQYVPAFIQQGAILFRPLSYYRDYEDSIRGDEYEGTRVHRPNEGLEITLTKNNEKILLPHTFESSANEDDIFIFCLSTQFSLDLAKQFNSDVCIEIYNPSRFLSELRAALIRRPSIKDKKLIHGQVNYYSREDPATIDWALPEKIAMSKLQSFQSQQEYRIGFGVKDAFRVENVTTRLVLPNQRQVPKGLKTERILKLGNLKKICRIHYFL